MLIPLVVLAVFSIVAGFVGVPHVLGGGDRIEQFLTPELRSAERSRWQRHASNCMLMAASIGAAIAGLALAYLFYVAKPELPETLAAKAHAMYCIRVEQVLRRRDLRRGASCWPIVATSREFLWKFVDVIMIDGAVNGIGQRRSWQRRRTATHADRICSNLRRVDSIWRRSDRRLVP